MGQSSEGKGSLRRPSFRLLSEWVGGAWSEAHSGVGRKDQVEELKVN